MTKKADTWQDFMRASYTEWKNRWLRAFYRGAFEDRDLLEWMRMDPRVGEDGCPGCFCMDEYERLTEKIVLLEAEKNLIWNDHMEALTTQAKQLDEMLDKLEEDEPWRDDGWEDRW